MTGRRIMTADEIRRATIRLSHEIVEKQAGTSGLLLIGIQRRGVPLARRIAEAIAENESVDIAVGALDITFYRDDLSLVAQQPIVKGTDLPFGIDGRTSLHQEDDLPRCLDRGYQVSQDLTPDQSPRRVGMLCDKRAHDLRGAVEHRDLEPMIGHIEGQVLSHDGQTNHPNVRNSLLSHTLPSMPRRDGSSALNRSYGKMQSSM